MSGYAIVPFGSSHYGDWMAAVEMQQAEFIAERYDETGNLIKVFKSLEDYGDSFLDNPSYHKNPSIRIGKEFFSAAIKDYDKWREKWWREAIQNSVDAGATSIALIEERVSGNVVRISVIDNGQGMDEDTIINKFLVLGASGKASDPTKVGGFGKAKELLILPWIGWGIESQGVVITGQNIEYEVKRQKTQPIGTRLSVLMSEDQCTAARFAIDYVTKCYLPNITFTVIYPDTEIGKTKEEQIYPNTHPGREVHRIGNKAVFYYKDPVGTDKSNRAFVRVNGVHMFSTYLYDSINGTLTIELHGDTKELLTANRDGFKDRELQDELSAFARKLAKESEREFRDKSGMVKRKFKRGGGKEKGFINRSQQFRALLNKQLFGQDSPIVEGADQKMVIRNPDEIEREVREILRPVQPEAEVPERNQDDEVGFPVELVVPDEVVAALLSIEFSGPNHVEAAIKQLAWQPDYLIWNEAPNFRIPRTFFPEVMSAGIMKTLRLWTELCRFILIQLKCPFEYGVGFYFATDAGGCHHVDDESDRWLLVNPFIPKVYYKTVEDFDRKQMIKPGEDRMYDLSNWRDVMLMYAIAVHECTHMADGVSWHDESFSTPLTYNFAKTSGMDKQIKQILRAVKKRR